MTAKYGVDPRASTLAGVISSTGRPTAASPAAIDSASARRAGAPIATSAAAPANHPRSAAWTEPNDISDVKVRTIARPIDGGPSGATPTPAQPGCSAGQCRREHPDTDCRRKPAGCEEPQIGVGRRHDRALVDVGEVGEQRHEDRSDDAAECHGDRRDPPRPNRRPQQPAHEHRNGEQSRAGDQHGQEPVGECVDATEEVGREHHDAVTEQPRHEEDDDHRNGRHDQPEEVGRRSDPLGLVVRVHR